MEPRWIVLYDGYCNLCSRTVRWIVRNDLKKRFTFLPLQAAEFNDFPARGLPETIQRAESVVLIIDGTLYQQSTAALKIAARLRFPWPLLSILLLVPGFIRNPIYRFIARNRKRWFGVRSTCYIP